jgi:antagonist of KipI
MDAFAFDAANVLAGNPPEAAVLEIGGGDTTLRVARDGIIAVTGGGYGLEVNVWKYPLWGSYFVRSGWTVRLSKIEGGMWAYLAVAGGLEASIVLGSRSTYLRGQIGGLRGSPLQAGDVLQLASPTQTLMETAGRALMNEALPAYSTYPTVEVVAGPQAEQFGSDDLDSFFACAYRVSSSSDRMGYRLEGRALTPRDGQDLPSEGLTAGAIEVPAEGQPIVMMADCPTVGGYPKIACVIRADMPLLAQCIPGMSLVRFRETTVEDAQDKLRTLMRGLRAGVVEAD